MKMQHHLLSRALLFFMLGLPASCCFGQTNPPPVYVIPVVFHIVSLNPDAIPDSVMINGLKDLNDAFAHTGPYAAGGPGANTGITFCLARTDPDGGITTGITRTKSDLTNFDKNTEDDRLKNLVSWDTRQYCNIWYVDGVKSEDYTNFSCGIWTRTHNLEYSTFESDGKFTDGVVTAGFGAPLAFLVAGYLGLHTTYVLNDCTNNNCAVDGDGVCDTPPASQPGGSCASLQNSCVTDTLSNHSNGFFPTDVPDLTSNFMSQSACGNSFTKGQAQKMITNLTTFRSGLIATSKCNPPCSENIVANFQRDNWTPKAGDIIHFTSSSTGGTNYQWSVDGKVVGSNSPSYAQVFPMAGKFKVTLKVYNTDGACYATYSDFILVNCGVTARFYPDIRQIAAKAPILLDSIFFTNRSDQATSFQWWMANDAGMAPHIVSTAVNLNYTFSTPGNYQVWLVASNGSCVDTTEKFYFPVYDPTVDATLYFNDVECYHENKLLVTMTVCNNGYVPIPAGTPVSFYDADPKVAGARKLSPTFFLPTAVAGKCCFSYSTILNITTPGLNQLYGVVNDSGTTSPLVLPNTPLPETNYTNNSSFTNNFQFKVNVIPSAVSLLPFDTLQLGVSLNHAFGFGYSSSFVWSTPQDLNCTVCLTPFFIAEKKIYTITKKLIGTTSYGCVDSSFVVISIPPYDDFTIRLDSADCAGSDSLQVGFTLCNLFNKGNIPSGLSVSLYDGDPASPNSQILGPVFRTPSASPGLCAAYTAIIKRTTTGKVFAAVNDNGTTIPLQLPNNQNFPEKNYANNVSSIDYKHFQVSALPADTTLLPGDTIALRAVSGPGTASFYQWSTPQGISCTLCDSTIFIAGKKDITKEVVAINNYGCADTGFSVIHIPPADDYTLVIDSINCSANDSLAAGFTICNLFKRGIIPKGLAVSFFDADPSGPGAHQLGPVFTVGSDELAKCASFNFTFKGLGGGSGSVYGVVNANGATIPLIFPFDTLFLEKDYTNNSAVFAYQPATVSLQPADTTILRKQSFPFSINTTIYDPASTAWYPGNGYTLRCLQCQAPVITVMDSAVVHMETSNQYGCLIKGTATVHVFPPDLTLQILQTSCYSNSTTLVKFLLCIKNNYDSLMTDLPVSFYDGNPSGGRAQLLEPVFHTPHIYPATCDTFSFIVNSPLQTKDLYAVVNDRGDNPAQVPDKVFTETDYSNNSDHKIIVPFRALISPSDTTVFRETTVGLVGSVTGGQLQQFTWQPTEYLSCSNCLTPVVTPPYSMEYSFIAQNENQCLDTAYAQVKTFAGGYVDIPNAFTPNGDGRNDIFYILGSRDIVGLKEFSIYTRLGQPVFHVGHVPANDPRYGWNGMFKGQQAAAGTYVYYVIVELAGGGSQLFKGTVVLVR